MAGPGKQAKASAIRSAPAAFALIFGLLAILLAGAGLLLWNGYAGAREAGKLKAAASAQIVATNMEWLVRASRQALDGIDRQLGPDPAHPPASFDAEIAALQKNLPQGVAAAVILPDGTRYPASAAGIDGLNQPGVLATAETPPETLLAAPSASETDPDQQSFILARKIMRGGQFAGTAALVIPTSVVTTLWRTLDLGPLSTITLVRDDGLLVARHPPTGKVINISESPLFKDYLPKSPDGTYETRSTIDNELRIVGYRRLANAPLLVTANLSTSYAMAHYWRDTWKLLAILVPLFAAIGGIVWWVTRLMRDDENLRLQLAAAAEHNTLLFREIHHRVKNNLQTVASLVQLQPLPADAKRDMAGRIAAMSAVHEQAYRMDQYTEVDLAQYLASLLDSIRKSYGDQVAITSSIAHLTVDRDLASPLGLIVNEVISNAMKHAFEGRERGNISVTAKPLDETRAELVIADDGVGYEPSDDHKGMGTRLVRALGQQLGNDFGYAQDNGTRFSIRFAARPAS
ncbi:sensor histidine kinase [Aestuariivirga sp.]|uniref:sensor histidine kinase n=1 Tax=Aestuariivirga sp. TaxID=2650926 RepID=UPI0039E62102